jgi:hypothetical protein
VALARASWKREPWPRTRPHVAVALAIQTSWGFAPHCRESLGRRTDRSCPRARGREKTATP